MAQCKKMLAGTERCSNRAVPGVDYCEEHRRIQFRPATEAAPPPPPQPERKKSKAASSQKRQTDAQQNAAAAAWTIRASADGETPSFPGLRADTRNILVAPQGLIRLREKKTDAREKPPGASLARLLGCLSQELSLAADVTIRRTLDGEEALLLLMPPEPDATDLSRFYDAVAAAAELSDGKLYVGQGRAFILYRDGGAARGYDADKVALPPSNELFLLDQETTHRVAPSNLTELSVPDLLLRMSLVPAREFELPERAFVMVAAPLYRMVARYLRDHHLRYRIARFHAPEHETLALIEIMPRRASPTGARVPAFVLNYLENLPRSVVLTEAWAEAGRRMLTQWGQRYPGNPRNVLPAFPPDILLLFNSDNDYPNLAVAPQPTFFEGDDVTSAQTPRAARVDLKPLGERDGLRFELPVKLVQDTGATAATAALILDAEEIDWIRRLLYRLPGEAFNSYTLCMGLERAVLLGESMAVEALPFGIALQRVQDTRLFIPLRTRFAPDLPWTLLAQALSLKDGVYTFLAEDFRLDIPRAAFTPLARALVADKKQAPEKFTLRQTQGLPELQWTPHPQAQSSRSTAPAAHDAPQGERQQQGFFERLLGGRDSEPQPAAQSPRARQSAPQINPQPIDEAALFRKRAGAFLQSGDHLSAAFCFALAGDNYNAARSYQEAARLIKEQEQGKKEAAG
ncbi:MAG: hypothetical protein QOF02_3696 [Blastocatellia bacterium]|jgi:hypothetical protein|nr:hypothetical protein [Blastocatellia bacterium]